MHGGTHWYVYKKDPCRKLRKATWKLVRALTFINYMKQSLSRALVMHAMLQTGLPEDMRERIYRMSNAMPIRNANYFCCKTKLNLARLLVYRNGRSSSYIKLWGRKKGSFHYIKA